MHNYFQRSTHSLINTTQKIHSRVHIPHPHKRILLHTHTHNAWKKNQYHHKKLQTFINYIYIIYDHVDIHMMKQYKNELNSKTSLNQKYKYNHQSTMQNIQTYPHAHTSKSYTHAHTQINIITVNI